MSIENFFEDLEAQFAAERSSHFSQPRLRKLAANLETGPMVARVTVAQSAQIELVDPMLGLDFLGGIRLATNTFQVFRHEAINQVQFLSVEAGISGKIKKSAIELAEFLDGLRTESLRVKITLRTANSAPFVGWLVGRNFMLLELVVQKQAIFIPLQSIESIAFLA